VGLRLLLAGLAGLAGLASTVVAVLAPVLGPTARAAEPIVNLVPPVVSGEVAYGETLNATPGAWSSESATYAYQWLRDAKPITGATGNRLRLDVDDLGRRISVAVLATDVTGARGVAVSTATGPVARLDFAMNKRPAADGVPRFTRTLTALKPRLRPRPATLRYRWLRDDNPIPGARGRTYRLTVGDVGHRVRVQVTGRREGYRTAVLRSPNRQVLHLVALRRTVTYDVQTRGAVGASVAEFRRQAQATFDDPRGWRGAGVGFRSVAGSGDFTLVLAVASAVLGFSSTCSAVWSCRVGRFVIINQTRWATASPTWNEAGRSLRDYRHLVVNHETGHWLGHGHQSCAGAGPAPVMMAQSKGTGGCSFNAWPLPSERWIRR